MKQKIENPWAKLIETENYCDDKDFEIIKDFNLKEKSRQEKYNDDKKNKNFTVRFDLIAEPFFGNPNADIIFLAANPGISINEQELALYKSYPKFKEDIIKYHKNGYQSIDYPFYYFNPIYDDYPGNKWVHPGNKWFKRRLRELLEESKLDWKELGNKILYLQYFPFHSKNFKNINKDGTYLNCQKYTFQLLADAISKESPPLVICFRCRDLWEKALKDNYERLSLIDYPNLIELNNARSVYVTKGNTKGDDFDTILKAL